MSRRLQDLFAHSIRNKLLALVLLPLIGVLPLLGILLLIWSDHAFDRVLKAKVRSDLAVAQGYFDRVQADVGAGTRAFSNAHALHATLASADAAPRMPAQLEAARKELGFDFLNLVGADGRLLASNGAAAAGAPLAGLDVVQAGLARRALTALDVVSPQVLETFAPALLERALIPLVPTRGAKPGNATIESRAMLIHSAAPVIGLDGRLLGVLQGGLLLNQNLDFIDDVNHIVYPDEALPFGSRGTATLFLDDVRITTNVRLFQGARAIGTRVSRAVHDAVLGQGQTWLDRALVIDDWYVSAYQPLHDARGRRIGMLYVGILDAPFVWLRHAMLASLGLIFGIVMLLAAWFSLRHARTIFKPLERMNSTMTLVETGHGGARVGALASRDEIGQLAGHLDRLLDVIDEKTEALQRWGRELDQKVAERTRELEISNASLRQTQRQLAQSEKLALIGQLTAGVAHEINNPIAVIQGNLDLLRELLGAHAAPVDTELRLIDTQVERMRLIVTRLLQFARPGEYAGYVQALDPVEVFEESLALVAHQLARGGIDVMRDWQAARPVQCNRTELQQVLINLMVNAIQAMPAGGTLTLATAERHGRVCLAVSDTGTGLAEAMRERLFTPFATTKVEGTGLGLWLSLNLVERYDGTIEVTGRADGAPGTMFTVSLP